MLKYVGYIRISSEDQAGNFSIDAQKRAIETWVDAHHGTIVDYYIDEAHSGRTTNRPEFLRMRRDAKKRKFDAIVVYKFDRFSRSRTDALAIKSLLRHEYKIKVFSVSEPSEDSDGALGTLIEGLMVSVAEWYSQNLATETVKGKRERARQGFHNNRPPFGLDKTKEGVLFPNELEVQGLRMAFELYSTGEYSDNDIAKILNEKGYRSKTQCRFSTDTIRDILQNRTYLGYIRYRPYKRNANGSRSYNVKVEWFDGKHDAVISEEIFDRCQHIRKGRSNFRDYYPKHRVYLLSNLTYCSECVANKPVDINDAKYGKMRASTSSGYYYYRCRARDFNRECTQPTIRAEILEEQVITFLRNVELPENWKTQIIESMGQVLGDKSLDERIAEIKQIIHRMDFRWDNGFIPNQDEYLEKRVQLQQELEQLTPIPDDAIERSANLINNFEAHWIATQGDRTKQKELIQLLVSEVWIEGDKVKRISLYPNYQLTLA